MLSIKEYPAIRFIQKMIDVDVDMATVQTLLSIKEYPDIRFIQHVQRMIDVDTSSWGSNIVPCMLLAVPCLEVGVLCVNTEQRPWHVFLLNTDVQHYWFNPCVNLAKLVQKRARQLKRQKSRTKMLFLYMYVHLAVHLYPFKKRIGKIGTRKGSCFITFSYLVIFNTCNRSVHQMIWSSNLIAAGLLH